jgi:hypothetical protein
MIGDLEEGFTRRVEREGAGAARRWYLRETIRAVPHLLGDWRRSLQMRDVRRLAGIILTSYVFAVSLGILLVGLTKGAFDAVGLSPHVRFGHLPNTQIEIMWFPVQMMCTVITGYLAAWLDNRAPVPTAMVTGVALACPAFVIAFSHLSEAAFFVVFAAVVQVGGATLGGILRVRTLEVPALNAG